ncbi:MAG: hypothetical protein ABJ275_02195 [Maricaulaceae bacterium]
MQNTSHDEWYDKRGLCKINPCADDDGGTVLDIVVQGRKKAKAAFHLRTHLQSL